MGNSCCNKKDTVYPETNNDTKCITRLTTLEARSSTELPHELARQRTTSRPSGKCTRLTGCRIIKALYTYTARADTDISFHKGDLMQIVDDSNKDWWKVILMRNREEGYVPVNYVAEESSVECEDWYFPNVSRKEAERLLLSNSYPPGTFLVRPAGGTHVLSLSVMDWDKQSGYNVKHYRIHPTDDGRFYIVTHLVYPSLSALVMAYRKSPLGLCQVLVLPCPKPEPQMWDLGPELRDKWEIPRSEIQLIRKLGQGNFGEVYYGKWRNHKEVAVKMLKKGTMSPEAFLEEATIMKTFRHKCLVALYAVCSTREPIYIVQEYMSKGSLLEFLRGQGSSTSFEDLVYIASQVASGMEYLESKKLIHRDLAARNVLVSDNNEAKICDFGLARVIEDEYCVKQGSRFPVKWTAPEAILYGTFSIKSDIWSFGILLMELFTYGQVPYPGLTGKDTMHRVLKGYRMPKPHEVFLPDNIYSLMLQCWDFAPENRPTFEFLNHYFESFTVTSEMPYREVQDQ